MKTTIITIATICSLALGTANASPAIKNNDNNVTVLTDVSRINKIEVRGNVEVYVSDGTADRVKIYNHYYAENALVQNQSGVLRIASYSDKKLVVWVTAADLRTISVYDNAEVKSFGTLAPISLDVQLYNTASAQLKLDAYNVNITVNDKAKVDLTGEVTEYQLKQDQATSVNYAGLKASNNAIIIKNNIKHSAGNTELAVL
ncbi:MAG: hypothetical protein EOP47_27315 [Sphingobacteriaceae bacterium]|nr:MAG: hypothetical protein EOP47_27315 [Sphingobacteriaceae bacterium]